MSDSTEFFELIPSQRAGAKAIEITKAELLEALAKAQPGASGPEEAMTSAEMAEAFGIGEKRLRKALHALKNEGRLEHTPVIRTSLDGRRIVTAGYVLIANPDKPARAKPPKKRA